MKPDQEGTFRPLSYLGGKVAILDDIRSAVESISPGPAPLLDLFGGSGVVARMFGNTRPVVTIDIQEYSRVLSQAQTTSAGHGTCNLDALLHDVRQSPLFVELTHVLSPLLQYEQAALEAASAGNGLGLAELVQCRPLIAHSTCNSADKKLHAARALVVRNLKSSGFWTSANTTVIRYFGGVYFSIHQALILDVLLAASNEARYVPRELALAATLSTAAAIVNTVGKHFAQPIRPYASDGTIKRGFISIALRDRTRSALEEFANWIHAYSSLHPSAHEVTAERADFLEALKRYGPRVGVVYADPPYTRDHYSRFYHVLETMCLRDEPEVVTVKRHGEVLLSRGVYRLERHQSPFSIRSTAPGAFRELFSVARTFELPLVLSYSPSSSGDGTHPRSVTIEDLLDLASDQYRFVEVRHVEDFAHRTLNRRELRLKQRDSAELLISCRP